MLGESKQTYEITVSISKLYRRQVNTNLETFPERFAQIFSNLLHPDAAHCSDGQCSDQRVRVFAILINIFHSGRVLQTSKIYVSSMP